MARKKPAKERIKTDVRIRMSAAQAEAIRGQAEKMGVSVASFFRVVALDYLDRAKAAKP